MPDQLIELVIQLQLLHCPALLNEQELQSFGLIGAEHYGTTLDQLIANQHTDRGLP
ncbi:hypothetical protein [Terrihabitans sp. B22-R8]|uniref:hypothetical protein n=1 Tax=Terrihabitans sp. B22-R8 TaxID=3425128 RepID=UPI00403D1E37